MEGALHAGPVVLAERSDPLQHVEQIAPLDDVVAEAHHAVGQPRLRRAAEVEDDLEQVRGLEPAGRPAQRLR